MPPRFVATDDGAPLYCCCEFIDRHGKRAHGLDVGACDSCFHLMCDCQPGACSSIVADIDDRVRCPAHGGSVHCGFDGLASVLLLPYLGNIAAAGPVHTIAVALAVPAGVLLLHRRSLRRRERSRFFIGWTVGTYAFGNLAFTLLVGERIWFGLWLACAGLQLTAAVYASMTRAPPPSYHPASTLSDAEDGGGSGNEDESLSGAPLVGADKPTAAVSDRVQDDDPSDGVVRCAMCDLVVPGYDHHCVWLDACIGRHNLGVFMRGCATLMAAVGLQGALCAHRAFERRVWGAEAVIASYAGIIVLGLLALLTSVTFNLARGVTAYQARRRRRSGQPLPTMSWATLVDGLRGVC